MKFREGQGDSRAGLVVDSLASDLAATNIEEWSAALYTGGAEADRSGEKCAEVTPHGRVDIKGANDGVKGEHGVEGRIAFILETVLDGSAWQAGAVGVAGCHR